jgi:hypothetical protein
MAADSKNTSANMGLSIPVPGQTTDPYWSAYMSQALALLDAHDHSLSKGARLSQASIQVTSNWDMRGYGTTNQKFVTFTNPSTIWSPAPGNASIYFVNGECYIKDGSGNSIQLTSGGGINASLVGGFTGDYATSAFCVYSAAAKTFSFYTRDNDPLFDTMAKVAVGSLEVRSQTAGANVYGFRLVTSGSLAASYSWTVPDTQAPYAGNIVSLDSSGVMRYLDLTTFVRTSGNQTVGGIKTFSSFPVTPSSAPTLDYEVANKKFVEDEIVDFDAPSDGTEYVRRDSAWVPNSGGSFPEAPVDSKQYARKNAAWAEVVIPAVPVQEAPIDGKQYARKNAGWSEVVTTGGLTPLTASGTLAVNTIYSVDASGDFVFAVPSGSANGDTVQVKRSGFGGANVFTGAFRNSETALILRDWNYALKLTWSATRSLWIYE